MDLLGLGDVQAPKQNISSSKSAKPSDDHDDLFSFNDSKPATKNGNGLLAPTTSNHGHTNLQGAQAHHQSHAHSQQPRKASQEFDLLGTTPGGAQGGHNPSQGMNLMGNHGHSNK